jgi:hypothetical protein
MVANIKETSCDEMPVQQDGVSCIASKPPHEKEYQRIDGARMLGRNV